MHAETLHYFGVLHHQRRRHAAAAELLDQALEIEPANAACWSNRGLVAAALGRHDEAQRCYWQALQLQLDFADARKNLGVTLQAQGELEGAVRQYRHAVALNPSLGDAHLNLGTALTKLEQYDEALACYEQALALDPHSAEAHFNAGNALTAKADSAAAIVRFRRAIELHTSYAQAHVNLGSATGKLGNDAEAEQQYRYAVALQPNPTHLVCLGGSLGAQGRLEGPAAAQLAEAPEAFRPHDFTADLPDFTDTAALVMNLDQVICVDAGVAHLTGALGKPVWVMLPANSDGRWLEHRSDSPWYPGARLFRQSVLGDWTPVLASVVEALRQERA